MRNTRFSADLKVVNFVNFRPDLLDWRQVERRDVRERIDLAFHIMDREYGVTRLLDPEGKQRFLVIVRHRPSRHIYILSALCSKGQTGN